jgi:hypothetical protein
MRDMRELPAGWYRDPVRPHLHRYWSGERWSDWVGEDLVGNADADDRYVNLEAG